MNIKNKRIQTYLGLALILIIGSLLLVNSDWQGSGQLHSLMEVVSTLLALMVGSLALVRFYSKSGTDYLMLGAGFIGVAMLDGYHMLVTSSWFDTLFPSDLSSLNAWSWLASRLFLSSIMLSLYLTLNWQSQNKSLRKISPPKVYSFIAITTLCSFLFFVFVPLPSGYFEGALFYRPEELIPGAIFALALIGLLKQGNWRTDVFSHWLILTIIINLVAQLVVMPYSSSLFDTQFDIAHLLKLLSYLCMICGLYISVFDAFKEADTQTSFRKKTQLSLEASEMRNRTMMNSLVDGLISINDTGIIENINVAACNLFGYSKLEVLGKNLKMLMPSPYHEEHDGYLSNYIKTRKKTVIGFGRKVTGLRKDGSTFPMDLSVSEMSIGGKMKYSGIIRDDTERLQNENELIKAKDQAQLAAEAKSNFLASMSHEIRTPMNGVLGMIELLQDTPLSFQQNDIVKTISNSGSALLDIINDILEYSKVEAGKIDIELITFNLEHTIYDVTRLLLVKAEEKGIELIFNFHTDCPDYVIGDAGRIRQIMLNLVGNAIKFTDIGQIVVEVRYQPQSKNNICIEVTDSGIGIDDNVKENLFQSFTQADNSTSRKYGGTGLGLSISKKLVDLMGGIIDVNSEPKKGSTFWVELNLEKTESPEKLQKIELNNTRVLIVDDNPVNLKILKNQLTKLNMQVDETSNPLEVMQLIRSSQATNQAYQLVIIDNIMPGLSADNLGREIMACEDINKIPLVLLTSATELGDAAIFKDIGFSAYLTKPILSDLLYQVLTRVLGLSRGNLEHDNFITRHTVIEDELETSKSTVQLNGKILLVEDILINQKVAVGLMAGFGLEIDIANNGEEALLEYSNNQYDLILMDCQMPIMDGFEATKKIRETDKAIPIIAITANALSTDREKCITAGMSDYLAKPFNRQQLIEVLSRWLEHTSLEENEIEAVTEDEMMNSQDNPLNFELLSNMKATIGAVFYELIPAYLQQSDEMIDSMHELLETEEIQTLERYAHSMKSSSLNVGAEKVSAFALVLEESCRENKEKSLIKTEIDLLIEKYRHAKEALLNYHERGNESDG